MEGRRKDGEFTDRIGLYFMVRKKTTLYNYFWFGTFNLTWQIRKCQSNKWRFLRTLSTCLTTIAASKKSGNQEVTLHHFCMVPYWKTLKRTRWLTLDKPSRCERLPTLLFVTSIEMPLTHKEVLAVRSVAERSSVWIDSVLKENHSSLSVLLHCLTSARLLSFPTVFAVPRASERA